MDHNLSYRGPIWIIQNPNIKFTTSAIIIMQETLVQITSFSNRKLSPKVGHHIGSKQGTIPITHYFAKQPLREKMAKQPLEWKTNKSRKNPYILERRQSFRKSRRPETHDLPNSLLESSTKSFVSGTHA